MLKDIFPAHSSGSGSSRSESSREARPSCNAYRVAWVRLTRCGFPRMLPGGRARFPAEHQFVGDLPVVLALGDHAQHLDFALGERLGDGGAFGGQFQFLQQLAGDDAHAATVFCRIESRTG